jgi:predicted SprT family Zn-dependent metalloprotease
VSTAQIIPLPDFRNDPGCAPVMPSPSGRALLIVRSNEREGVDPATAPITPIEYGGLQEAFDHFNATLFEAALPDVLITYQRKASSAGYFSPNRFSGRVGEFAKHELALNPDSFIGETDEQICQTLVHEMAHLWQQAFGKPSAHGYHNAQWASKMKAIGLQPSSTGMVGGKETGQRMMDYLLPDGPFTKAYAALAATGWRLNLQSAYQSGSGSKGSGSRDASKTPFRCPGCGARAWGKSSLSIACVPCAKPFEVAP